MVNPPRYLTANGKKYWQTLKPIVTPLNHEVVGVLCQVYSDYLDTIGSKDAATLRRQKSLLEVFCKLTKELGLLGTKKDDEEKKQPTGLIELLQKVS